MTRRPHNRVFILEKTPNRHALIQLTGGTGWTADIGQAVWFVFSTYSFDWVALVSADTKLQNVLLKGKQLGCIGLAG